MYTVWQGPLRNFLLGLFGTACTVVQLLDTGIVLLE